MYESKIDQETWDFIEKTERFYPPDAESFSIAEQRNFYDELCKAFRPPRPRDVNVSDENISNGSHVVPVRNYAKVKSDAKAHVLYMHGGGFVVGGLDSHDDVCAEICERTGFGVTAVDYRLSPEHSFPDDFEDCIAAFRFVANKHSLPVILVGDSAGASLAAALSHALRGEEKQPCGQILIYPSLGSDFTKGSFIEHANAPMLTTESMKYYLDIRIGNNQDLITNPKCVVLADDDFSNLPPTFIVSAECDPLASDGETYQKKMTEAGGKAVWINEQGLVHGFLRARHSVRRARDSFTKIIDAISAFGVGTWPYA